MTRCWRWVLDSLTLPASRTSHRSSPRAACMRFSACVPHHAGGTVDDLGAHLLARGGRAGSAGKRRPARRRPSRPRRPDSRRRRPDARTLLGLLAHRDPDIGVDGVGSGHRLGRVGADDHLAAVAASRVDGDRVEPVAGRAGQPDVRPRPWRTPGPGCGRRCCRRRSRPRVRPASCRPNAGAG